MRFASFLSGEFTTMAVINPPERKLAKRTSVQWNNCKADLPYSEITEESGTQLKTVHICSVEIMVDYWTKCMLKVQMEVPQTPLNAFGLSA